jgi:hypothetical protein
VDCWGVHVLWAAALLAAVACMRCSGLPYSPMGSVLKVEMLTSFGDFISFKTETWDLAPVTYLHM